jgi:4-alpha-glucanotransferase
MHRTSGILLHPTSLPGPFGIGDLGPAAYRFVDFLAAAGQGLWQVLPLGPTGYRDSPYQCTSACAGNPLLISPEQLLAAGWIDAADLEHPEFPEEQVDFGPVHAWKFALLVRAHQGFLDRADQDQRDAYDRFQTDHQDWLSDYALYAALKAAHADRPWTEWPAPLALRDPAALSAWTATHGPQLDRQRLMQFLFFSQWSALRDYAHGRGAHLVGDMPIFVAHDSAEVWTHREWFQLEPDGQPRVIAGVPPDYFSPTGQRWGNPLYDWAALAADGYRLWKQRLRRLLAVTDLVRVDHFRGFAGYWEIPASEPTAVNGRWVPGPGMDLFRALRAALGEDLPLIAEDLGVITPDVESLRDGLELPGMAILQFAFDDQIDGYGQSAFLPHNHRRRLVVYTGTHDNNTTAGWWSEQDAATRGLVCRYLDTDGEQIHWDLIRAALASVAALALFPLQDLLGAGAEATMNRPGTAEGNWSWRVRADALQAADATRLLDLSRLYGRRPYVPSPDPAGAPP